MKIDEMKLKDISKETLIKYVSKLKKEPSLPTSWEELEVVKGYYVDSDNGRSFQRQGETKYNGSKTTFATQEQADASIALAQLSQLMKVYNDGWTPNWEDDTQKWVLYFYCGMITTASSYNQSCFLAFKTEKISGKFCKNFNDLIEQAKPLL